MALFVLLTNCSYVCWHVLLQCAPLAARATPAACVMLAFTVGEGRQPQPLARPVALASRHPATVQVPTLTAQVSWCRLLVLAHGGRQPPGLFNLYRVTLQPAALVIVHKTPTLCKCFSIVQLLVYFNS